MERLLIMLLIIAPFAIKSQILSITELGDTVFLNQDGTWDYRMSGYSASQFQANSSTLAYSLKGDTLGMFLEDFKQRHKRIAQGDNSRTLPWCSDASFDNEISTLGNKLWHKQANIVHCRTSFPFEASYGVVETIGGIEMLNILYRFKDDSLYQISALFASQNFNELKARLIQKYGSPTSEELKVYQNRMGASFQGEVLEWDNGISTIYVREYSSTTEYSFLEFSHISLLEKAIKSEPPPPTSDF